MNSIQQLLTDHIDIWTAADTEKKSGRGRSSNNTAYGIKKLRELILDLAVHGKLVLQDPNDEPASELLKQVQAEKSKLIIKDKNKKYKPLELIIKDKKPFNLPQGWVWGRLSSIGITSTGRTPNTQNSSLYGGLIPFIGPGQISDKHELLEAEKWLTDAARNETTIAKKGDILMVCIGGSIGKSTITDKEVAFNQQINCLSPFCVNGKFIQISMMANYFQVNILKSAAGSATPIINKSKWEGLLIPIAPISEQHRIVAKVDDLMELCDQMEAQHKNAVEAHEKLVNHFLAMLTQSKNSVEFNQNWKRISEHFNTLFITEPSIDALQQTLLQLAVMGKLVPQDPNDEPASELVKQIQIKKNGLITGGKSKKNKSFPPIADDEKLFEIPYQWQWVRLNDVCSYIQRGKGPSYVDKSDFSVISQKCIRWSGLDLAQVRYIDPNSINKYEEIRLVREGDILWNSTGTGTIGRACSVPKMGKKPVVVVDSHVTIVRPVILLSMFLLRWIQSPPVQSKIETMASGTTNQIELNTSTILSHLLPLPPLSEQHRIVEKIDELFNICDQLKSKINSTNISKRNLANIIVNHFTR